MAVKQGRRRLRRDITGAYRFPVEKAAKIAVSTVAAFLQENEGALDLVVWVLFDENTKAVYEAAVEDVKREEHDL